MINFYITLAISSSSFPQSLYLDGITEKSERPVAVGGFGDVWKARYKNGYVALKVLRLALASDDRLIRVRT